LKKLVCGIRPVIEAINSGQKINKLLLQYQLNYKKLYELIKKYKIPVKIVPRDKLNRVAGKKHQGVLAFISPISFYKIEKILPYLYEIYGNPLLLIVDRVNDVRNIGAIVRTAECTGVGAIIINNYVSINYEMIKASSGAILKIPICKVNNINQIITILKLYFVRIISSTEKTNKLFYNSNLSIPIAIILGNESNGISKEYLIKSDEHVNLPILGNISSLNVSVTCGVILYEALRQRLEYKFFKLL
jgi:23S rRNA (guanosine2251-2'-O)-methyltransferase